MFIVSHFIESSRRTTATVAMDVIFNRTPRVQVVLAEIEYYDLVLFVAQAALYNNPEARTIAFQSYDGAMELWPVEYQKDWVGTEHGRTHVIVSGPEPVADADDYLRWFQGLPDRSETFVKMDGGIAWKGFWNFMDCKSCVGILDMV